MSRQLAALPANFEPTRATLHRYARVAGVVPRTHATPHEKWWHVSLKITEQGLGTDPMQLPDGRSLKVQLDLAGHAVVVTAGDTEAASFSMDDGMTATAMGDAVLGAVARLGLEGEYDRDKFESDEPLLYDREVATRYFAVLRHLAEVLSTHRDGIGEPVGPIQVWPHGFDMAFEWFGSRIEEYEENGEVAQQQAQCNFGFYPGGRAYLYANPWPFQSDRLMSNELPGRAQWHTEGWEGSQLYFDEVADQPDGEQRILDYFAAVFAAAAPTLRA